LLAGKGGAGGYPIPTKYVNYNPSTVEMKVSQTLGVETESGGMKVSQTIDSETESVGL
jgi:hypothetical protein